MTTACLTCGAALAPVPIVRDDDGEESVTAPFCSIHCEHYHGLRRAATTHAFPG